MSVALITGAASNTGFAIAKRLLGDGMTVYINDFEPESAAEQLGEGARSAPCDLSRPEQIESMFERILDESGQIDVLVNNTCHLGLGYSFTDTPLDFFDDVLAVNLRSVFYCSRLAATDMMKRRRGSIVLISSVNVKLAIPDRCAYIAAKGGVEALGRAMALELGPHGIRVNTVAPGYIHTDRWNTLAEETAAARRNSIPLRSEAKGEDIADAVAFLSSDHAKNITGTTLSIDGGIGCVMKTI